MWRLSHKWYNTLYIYNIGYVLYIQYIVDMHFESQDEDRYYLTVRKFCSYITVSVLKVRISIKLFIPLKEKNVFNLKFI
jgi:membrane protein CcdC involved in cytochrome C biogenesis